MRRKYVISLIIIFMVFGISGYFLIRSNNSVNDNLSMQKSEISNSESKKFEAVPNNNISYTATITNKDGDKVYVSTVEYDSDSKISKYNAEIGGSKSTIYFTENEYVFCQTEDNCIKYSNNSVNASSFDPNTISFDEKQINELKNSSVFKETSNCVSGECEVWKINREGLESTYYIYTDTKRLAKFETQTPTGSAEVVYLFKDISLSLPENAQTIPAQ